MDAFYLKERRFLQWSLRLYLQRKLTQLQANYVTLDAIGVSKYSMDERALKVSFVYRGKPDTGIIQEDLNRVHAFGWRKEQILLHLALQKIRQDLLQSERVPWDQVCTMYTCSVHMSEIESFFPLNAALFSIWKHAPHPPEVNLWEEGVWVYMQSDPEAVGLPVPLSKCRVVFRPRDDYERRRSDLFIPLECLTDPSIVHYLQCRDQGES